MKKVFVIVAVVLACSLILGVLVRLGGSASHVVGPSIFGGGSDDPEDIGGAGDLIYIGNIESPADIDYDEDTGVYTVSFNEFLIQTMGPGMSYGGGADLGTFSFSGIDPQDICVGFSDMVLNYPESDFQDAGSRSLNIDDLWFDFSINYSAGIHSGNIGYLDDGVWWNCIPKEFVEDFHQYNFTVDMHFDDAFSLACFLNGRSPDDPVFDSSSDSYDEGAFWGVQAIIQSLQNTFSTADIGDHISLSYKFYAWLGSEFVAPPED